MNRVYFTPRIYGLTYTARFPSHLYARPSGGGAEFLDTPRFRVWPAGYYAENVIVEAVNEHQARTWGAIELGVSVDKVKLVRLPAQSRLAGKGCA